jgi:Protein of unknown function (DUF3565)
VKVEEAHRVRSPRPGGLGPMTIARPLDLSTSRPLDLSTSRPLDLSTTWSKRPNSVYWASASDQPSQVHRSDLWMRGYSGHVERAIVGFHRDDEGDFVAELSCGHSQHVRHQPPFRLRPWVLDAKARTTRIGTAIECPLCDRQPTYLPEEGGEPACLAGSLCVNCGAVMDGGPHRSGCRWSSS